MDEQQGRADPPEESEAPTAVPGKSPDTDAPPVRRLGDFELLSEIGRGGMGVVYEARQISLRRRVALKVLPPAMGLTPQARERFEREAQAAAKLHHTNIVPVHAIGEHEGHHFYAMDLIEGQSLDRVLREVANKGSSPLVADWITRGASSSDASPAPAAEGGGATSSLSDTSAGSRRWFDAAARLISEVADGLDYAHGRGIIHRDIKPANLMLSREGRLCITDFGLARIVQEPGMTVSGSFLGTPAYMSPEQIAAGRMKLDHRTDVYSLGAVLYEMLTLQRPFPGDSREEVVGAIMTKDPRPPRRFNSKIPQDLETICLKALEKDPDRRYATAGEFAQDLRRYNQGGLIEAKRAGLLRRTGKWIRRHPVAGMALLAAVLVAGVGAVAWRALAERRLSNVGRMVADARLLMERGEYRDALAATDEVLRTAADNIEARLIHARLDLHRWHWWEVVDQSRQVLELDRDNWEAHLLIAAAAKKGALYSVPAEEHRVAVEGLVPETAADAFFLRGWIASFDGRHREALQWLDRALVLDPGHALALETRSDRYVDLKDLDAALADAERLAAARPRGSDGPRQQGYIYMMLHDERRALEAFSRAIELEPDNALNYYQRSRIHEERGRRDEQLADLNRAVELDPDGDFYWARGTAYRATGEYDRALADYDRALEVNPDDIGSYWSIFLTHQQSGRPEEARAVIDKLQARAASWKGEVGLARYHDNLAYLYYRLEEQDRAIAEAERAVALRPDWIRAHKRLADVRRAAKGQTAIAADCDRLAALELHDPGQFYERATVMSGTCRQTEQALADFGRAIELAGSWAEPYRDRGLLLKNEKRFEEALADCSRAIELTPSWVGAVHDRGRLYADMERFEEALADYDRCVELGAEGAAFHRDRAEALLRLGREREALAVLDTYIASRPDDAWGYLNRASALARLGRIDEALVAADRAVAARPAWAVTHYRRAVHASAAYRPELCSRVGTDFAEARRLGKGRSWSDDFAELTVLNFYYHCPELYDAAESLALAREGAEYDSKSSLGRAVYGMALYRDGKLERARDFLSRALRLGTAEDPRVLLFLAMTSSRLGEARQARYFYDRAVARRESTFPEDPLTLRVEREAAEVLSVR